MKRDNTFSILRYLFIMMLLVLTTSSCEKFVDTDLPPNIIPAEVALNSDGSLTAALLGAYASVLNTSTTLAVTTSLFADDILMINATTSNLQAQENTYDETTDYQFFSNYYKAIYNTNVILEALTNADAVAPALVKQVTGECKFLRAFCYYRLVSLYGNVPLVLTSDVTISAYLGNTPSVQIYDSMIKDLLEARELLPVEYPSADRVRANRYTVNALLARYYALKKEWVLAEQEASSIIIASTTYSLPTDLNVVFLKGSQETIWQLWNKDGYTSIGGTYVPSNPTGVFYQIRPSLVSAFDADDKRKTAWIKAGTGAAVNQYYPYKYKQRLVTTGNSAEYLVQFRLAEQYLIRAEARAQQNKITEALADLNVVHGRANPTLLKTTDQAELLLMIEQERRLELMTEEGLRWFDLNRTGRTSFWLSPLKPTFTPKATLLPYPTAILLANPNLTQNPGY